MAATSVDPPASGKKPEDGKKEKEKKEEEAKLSEEDQKMKDELDGLVATLTSNVTPPSEQAIEQCVAKMTFELQNATSSMTSVPKPLRFLRPHFDLLRESYEKMDPSKNSAKKLADVLSVLATTRPGDGLCLKFLLQGTMKDITSWDQEFMRNLAGEISTEFQKRMQALIQENGEEVPEPVLLERMKDLTLLVDEIVPFQMSHSAEIDAVDLLMEVDQIEKLTKLTEPHNFSRVARYISAAASFAAEREDRLKMLSVAYDIYVKQREFPSALRLALKMDDSNLVKSCFESPPSVLPENAAKSQQKQMALLVGRHRGLPVCFGEQMEEESEAVQISVPNFSEEEVEELQSLANNGTLSLNYLSLARDLDVLEPKNPEDIFKAHLEERRGQSGVLDSAKQNLASSFVNGFVNAGFCKDNLLTIEGSSWLFKNKALGMTSTAASLGSLLLWDVDEGLSQIDKYQWSSDEHVKAGALMAFGLCSSNVQSELDPAWALLEDHLRSDSPLLKLSAIVGLGFAYCGTRKSCIMENLTPIIVDTECSLEACALAAVSLALVHVGSGNDDIAQTILLTIIDRQATAVEGGIDQLDTPMGVLLACSLGLLFLGAEEKADDFLKQMREEMFHPFGDFLEVVIVACAFAGTGDVLRIQEMLQKCAKEPPAEKEDQAPPAPEGQGMKDEDAEEAKKEKIKNLVPKAFSEQAMAVLGIGLVALGEDIGTDMSLRSFDRLLQYGGVGLRRAVPLALALLHLSNPKVTVIDTLRKLSHDVDEHTSLVAILAMGLVGAGTNNSRLAGLLRQLAGHHARDADALFMVRIAQGLLYCGKGLISLSPLHNDRFLLNKTSLASMLIVLFASMNPKDTILGSSHYLLHFLTPCMFPRMLVTFDEDLKPLSVQVRVGQAVDTIGQAGKPKTVTGFQTHMTPVLLSYTDRAELATEEYLPVGQVLEGMVILKKNPDYKPEQKEEK